MNEKLELIQAVSVIAYALVEHLLGKTKQGSLIGIARTGLLALLSFVMNSAKTQKSLEQEKV